LKFLKNNPRYWLEYDFYNKSDGQAEIIVVDGTSCIYDNRELYCMASDYDRSKTNDITRTIASKAVLKSGSQILFNFNISIDDNIDDEIRYLSGNGHKHIRIYDSYVSGDVESSIFHNNMTASVVELTKENFSDYRLNECNENNKFRPTLEHLIEVFIGREQGNIIVYVENGSVLGYLSYIEMFYGAYDIDYIFVPVKYRRRGIGSALGGCYIRRAHSENKKAFWSNVNEGSLYVALNNGCNLCCRHLCFTKQY